MFLARVRPSPLLRLCICRQLRHSHYGSHNAACQHRSAWAQALVSAYECVHSAQAFVLWVHCIVRETFQLVRLTLSQLQQQMSCPRSTSDIHAHALGLSLWERWCASHLSTSEAVSLRFCTRSHSLVSGKMIRRPHVSEHELCSVQGMQCPALGSTVLLWRVLTQPPLSALRR